MAGTSVLKLKVDDKEYNASLKQAQQGLQHLGQALNNAGKSFTQVDKSVVEYVRSIGQMEAQSKSARGRIGEMSNAFIELSLQYKQMSDEVKSSDVGKALAESMQQLKQRTVDAKKELENLNNELNNVKMPEAKGGGLFSGLGDKMSGAIQVFAGNMLTKAAGAVASLGSEIADMVKQGVELAKQGEGIRNAFERLGRGDILDGLRQATHGTVTDIELMKAAVKFNDFKLPLDELGTMLAFAQQKAKDTGQSVDYMVDSIVTGLGRKSLMILDNLGLSATEVKEKMAETGDMTKAVGAIIREQMSKAGDYVETAADRAAQANVSLQNKMEELGRKFAPVEEASNQLWTSMKIGILDIVGGPLATLLNQLTEAGRLKNALNDINGDGSSGNTVVGGKLKQLQAAKNSGASQYMLNTMQSSTIEGYNRQIMKADELLKQFEKNHSSVNVVLQNATKQFGQEFSSISELEAWRDAYKVMVSDYRKGASEIMKPVKVNIQTDNAIKSVDELKVKLAELQAQRKKAIAAGDTDLSKNLAKQISQVKSDIKGLGGSTTNKTTTKTVKTKEQLNNDEIQKLTQEYIKASDDRRKAIEVEIKTLQDRNAEIKRLMEVAQGKVAPEGSLKALSEELSKLQQERQLLSDPIDIEIQDQAIKDVQDEIDRLNGKKVEVELVVDNRIPFEKLKDSLKIEIAEENMQVDTTTLQTLMKTAIQNGIDGLDPNFSALQEKMRDGMNIPDETWQALQDEINEKLKELGIEPIKIDFKTGNIAKEGEKTEKSWQAAAKAVQTVGSAMQSIEDPAAKIAGTVAQAIATIALGYANAMKTAGDLGPVAWIAFAATGLATMLSTISSIHSATGYANGGIVKGNSYSGDNIPAMINGGAGGFAGLNAGEIVLNKAAQGNLASQLQGAGMGGMQVIGEISGEKIVLIANRFFKRTGQGEIVTW